MTVDKVQDQAPNAPEQQPVTVQNELQKEILKQTLDPEDTNKQLLMLLSTVAPQQQILETAKNQISKGYLDIKV